MAQLDKSGTVTARRAGCLQPRNIGPAGEVADREGGNYRAVEFAARLSAERATYQELLRKRH